MPYDPYYQEWHFQRTETAVDVDQEWWIDVPKPLGSPGSGKYWAIEIHSIELQDDQEFGVTGELAYVQSFKVCVTSAPRTGKLPFITTCANPDNIFYYGRKTYYPTTVLAGGLLERSTSRGTVLQRYTDDQFHGKLYIGDHLYVQIASAGSHDTPVTINLCIEFTWTTINCNQLVEELQGQLNES